MPHTVTVEIPDDIYEPLAREAQRRGETPQQVLLRRLKGNGQAAEPAQRELTEDEYAVAMARLMRHAGSVDMGRALGIDKLSVDSDLAREYGSMDKDRD